MIGKEIQVCSLGLAMGTCARRPDTVQCGCEGHRRILGRTWAFDLGVNVIATWLPVRTW